MIEIRALGEDDLDRAGAALPLHRFERLTDDNTYLIAWDDEEPVGHVHIAWTRTELALPELQDMYVLPDRRGRGIGAALAAAAERLAARRGYDRCSLSVSVHNADARRLYERLGYVAADRPPKRVQGTIEVRGGSIEVDDTLVYLTKHVDLAPRRSS